MANKTGRRFETTNWSRVRLALDEDDSRAREALESIASAYWYPIYSYVRHLGFDEDEAKDITQSYFVKLLERNYLETADPARGNLRTFLRVSVRNFVSDWRRFHRAQRRAPKALVSLDHERAEARYASELKDDETPESIFERAWAAQTLTAAFNKLRNAEHKAGRGRRFKILEGYLTSGREMRYADASERLGISSGAVKVAVHRLRVKLDQLVKSEIAETVSDPAELATEVQHLKTGLES